MPDSALHEAAKAVARGVADLDSGHLVLVGCSGGPDSLALAAASAKVAARAGSPRFGAVIVDHQLQAESAQVASQTQAKCVDLGLDPVVVMRVSVGDPRASGGPEAAARAARRRALADAAASLGAAAVLLAHTLDDQAETVLLGLARGSGARSLAGMATVDGIWRRPVLRLRRGVLARACVEAGLSPHLDPQNQDLRFARNRVRAVVLPTMEAELGEGSRGRIAEALSRSAELLRADADALDRIADSWLEDREWGPGKQEAAVVELAALPRAVRTRVLRKVTIRCGSSANAVGHDHVWRIDRLITDWHGQGSIALPGGRGVRRSAGMIEWFADTGRGILEHQPADRG